MVELHVGMGNQRCKIPVCSRLSFADGYDTLFHSLSSLLSSPVRNVLKKISLFLFPTANEISLFRVRGAVESVSILLPAEIVLIHGS